MSDNLLKNLPPEETQNLKVAFEKAKQNVSRPKGLKAAADPWGAAGNFDSAEHDVFLSFDYNKNTVAVPPEDEAAMRFVMQVVQSQGTHELANASKDFTHDSECWINFFCRYPLLFNFQSRITKTYKEDDFTLSGSVTGTANFVKTFLGYSSPEEIAVQLIGAIQSASGPVLSTQTTDKHLQYLVIARGYDKASTLTIYRAQLDMKVAEVKSICGGTKNVSLSMSYDEVVIELNNYLALALYPTLSKQAEAEAEKYILTFFTQFAAEEYSDFEKHLKSL
jgi:hypothetical protein